jgi:hypothetical protein
MPQSRGCCLVLASIAQQRLLRSARGIDRRLTEAGVQLLKSTDYMYVNAIWTKADADRLFREALIIDGVPRWLAGIMHKAVRFGGRGAYKKGG